MNARILRAIARRDLKLVGRSKPVLIPLAVVRRFSWSCCPRWARSRPTWRRCSGLSLRLFRRDAC